MDSRAPIEQFNQLTTKGNIFLAPIAGFTDSPFRRIVRKFTGAPVITELISADGIVRENKKTLDLLKFHDDERPLGIQIFGKIPEIMGEAAAAVNDLKPDFIDLNMGCPAMRVSGSGGSGAALLRDPVRVREITEKTVSKALVPVSAKIRIGWDDGSKNYRDIVKALADGGISFITVHGRTASQRYRGTADWDVIREIAETSSVPIVGNGDISSLGKAMERLNSSRCSGVMIGRCAIGNPWIFAGEKPSTEKMISLIIEHLELMIEFYGARGVILMRKHLVKYIHGIRNASSVRRELVTVTDKEKIIAILQGLIYADEAHQ